MTGIRNIIFILFVAATMSASLQQASAGPKLIGWPSISGTDLGSGR